MSHWHTQTHTGSSISTYNFASSSGTFIVCTDIQYCFIHKYIDMQEYRHSFFEAVVMFSGYGNISNIIMEADLMITREFLWTTLDEHTYSHKIKSKATQQKEKVGDGPQHTFLTCLITPLPFSCPRSLFHHPFCLPPAHPPPISPHHRCSPLLPTHPTSSTLQGEKADLHSAASLRKEEMNKRKETSRWQSMSALPGAKITVSKCSGLSKMPQRQNINK